MPVGMVPEGANMDYLGDFNYVRGRLELEVVFNKSWGKGAI